MSKVDLLVLAAHPDDAELGCGGTVAKHVAMGWKVAVVDFTRGELGTRGSVPERDREAAAAAKILGLTERINLDLRDGFFQNTEADQRKVIEAIRYFQPDIVLANAITDRHPDHGKGAQLAFDSCFLAGLEKIRTHWHGYEQKAWRPKAVYHFMQSQPIKPDFIVDVSDHWDTKMKAIRAFSTQFFQPNSREPVTFISTPEFLKMLESRAVDFGHAIGVRYGEGFTVRRTPGVNSLRDIF
ncbi:MAG: bacillithiol biosynthesis deacetylase BshB1 [Cyclobacteriaceae bacterium]|jgi:bacillithiol biosynthesis deacetylase BshB1|nr:bacillithiol biosynthesis deacetylase BshB1 [Flammeovirgaceae bacterium]